MLEELKSAGYLKSWGRAESFTLSEAHRRQFTRLNPKGKLVQKEKDLVTAHVYTPDFKCEWATPPEGLAQSWDGDIDERTPFFYNKMLAEFKLVSYFEVKPLFNAHGKTQWSAAQIKWVLDKHGIYVQMVKIGSKPKSFFDKAFCPDRYRLTDKTMKPRAIGFKPKSLSDIMAALSSRTCTST